MRKFREPNREQLLMLATVNLDSIAPVGSVLHSIDALVEQLDTSEIESSYDFESKQGTNPFHPKTMIKVALYAMHNCRFSLRKMEEDTIKHLGYQWLTGNESIDHSTMGKFLLKYKSDLPELLSQIIFIGVEHELIDFEVLNIDTVKIRANASYKQFRTNKAIKKEQEKLKKRLAELIVKACNDEEEKRVLELRQAKLDHAKNELLKRISSKTQDVNSSKKDKIKDKEKINITDPDCSLIQQANGEINSAYAITMASDSKSDFITYVDVQDKLNDPKALIPAIQGSRENTGGRHDTINADSGFSSIENLEELEDDNQFALMPDRRMEAENKGLTSKGDFDRSNFKYNKKKDYYKCPKNNNLKKITETKVNNRIQCRYANIKACEKCKVRAQCTKGKYRIISRDSNEEIKEQMHKRFLKDKNSKIYNQRAHAIESPFGQIKHNLKYRIFMRRTQEKIKMEITLLAILHNIMKISTQMAFT